MDASVDAPEDWLPEQPDLRHLEQSLRCEICRELFVAPVVLTGCGHLFCSECIREALEAGKKECPTCHKTASDSHIRSVPLMEEIVARWSKSRATLLALAKNPARSPPPVASTSMKRKSSSDIGPRAKGKSRALEADSSLEIIEPEAESQCPVCQKVLPIAAISAHLDRNCNDNSKESWNKMFGGSTSTSKQRRPSRIDRPLPKENFSTSKQAKDWLRDHDLPVDGAREVLLKRVDDWIMLVNANLNRGEGSGRQNVGELRKRLLEREKQRQKTKPEVTVDHQTQHSASFKELTAQIRARGQPPTKKASIPQAKDIIDVDSEGQDDNAASHEGASAAASASRSVSPVDLGGHGTEGDGEGEQHEDEDMLLDYRLDEDGDERSRTPELVGPLDPLPIFRPPRPPPRPPSPYSGLPPPASQNQRIHM